MKSSHASTMAASPLFMSAAPRPYRKPSRTTGAKGSLCHSSSGPGGTTSVCPAKQNSGPDSPRRAHKLSTWPKRRFSTLKPSASQPLAHERLTAAVGGTDRGSRHQVAGQSQGIGHQNLRTGGRRRRLAQSPQSARHTAAISTQPGMESPRKRQLILAHSPEPVSTLAMTCGSGETFSMKSSDAPQAGTLSGGRLWM